MYPITVNLIPGLPNTPFRNGVGAYEGIVMHATASWEDSAEGERNYEGTHWCDAFVHFFSDHDSIVQVADTDFVAWGAGSTANKRYLHSELCQSRDPERFKEAYNRWIYVAAYHLFKRGLGVIKGETILSHHMVSDKWHETTHEDPDSYLAYHGKTFDDVINDVSYLYKCMEAWAQGKVYGQKDPEISVTDAAVIINVLSKFWGWADTQADKDEIHRQADEIRKASGQLGTYTGLDVDTANAIIWKLGKFWDWSNTQEDKDEYHRLADIVRVASGQPT